MIRVEEPILKISAFTIYRKTDKDINQLKNIIGQRLKIGYQKGYKYFEDMFQDLDRSLVHEYEHWHFGIQDLKSGLIDVYVVPGFNKPAIVQKETDLTSKRITDFSGQEVYPYLNIKNKYLAGSLRKVLHSMKISGEIRKTLSEYNIDKSQIIVPTQASR